MDPNVTSENAAPATSEQIDSLLGELELDTMSDTTEAIVEPDLTDLSAEDEAVIETAGAAAEAYVEQPVTTTDIVVPEATEAAPAAEAPVKAKKERKPRVSKDISTLAPEHFVLVEGGVACESLRDDVLKLKPTQKKVAEKFENLFASLAAGRAPSVYVMACFAVLDKAKTVKSTDLVASLKATSSRSGSGYDEGTARSQAGQMMILFDAVGIATRNKQELTLRADSAIAAKLRAMLPTT